jgi:hypothetical protein
MAMTLAASCDARTITAVISSREGSCMQKHGEHEDEFPEAIVVQEKKLITSEGNASAPASQVACIATSNQLSKGIIIWPCFSL